MKSFTNSKLLACLTPEETLGIMKAIENPSPSLISIALLPYLHTTLPEAIPCKYLVTHSVRWNMETYLCNYRKDLYQGCMSLTSCQLSRHTLLLDLSD